MSTLGERVARAIGSSKCDVADIAKACGVTLQAVYSWQRGEVKNLRGENLFSLADVTGFNARWIATGKGSDQPEPLDQKEKNLLDMYRACDDRGRATVVRAAEFESSYDVKKDDNQSAAA